MKKTVCILLFFSLVIPFSGCSRGKQKYSAEYMVFFDTVTQVIGYMDSKAEFDSFSSLVHDELKTYHQLYNIYNDFEGISNVKTINDNAGKAPVKVDRKIIDLLILGRETYQRSGGSCNIAMGAVLKLWHDYRDAGIDKPDQAALPPMDKLKEASTHTDIADIIIDESASTVYLSDPEMSLDVGAIAKGYATERIAEDAEKAGFTSGLLNVGGNVCAIGGKNGDTPWKVSVRDPDGADDSATLLTVAVKDMSVVTSGIYERYYTVNGKKYNHIINPATLMPAAYFKSVTILCRDSGLADELSTTLFCMSYEDGLKIVKSLSDTEAMWVTTDGKQLYSDHFKDYITK